MVQAVWVVRQRHLNSSAVVSFVVAGFMGWLFLLQIAYLDLCCYHVLALMASSSDLKLCLY